MNNYYEKVVASTENILTVLDRLGDFASRISRREFCHKQQREPQADERRWLWVDDFKAGRLNAGVESKQATVAGRV